MFLLKYHDRDLPGVIFFLDVLDYMLTFHLCKSRIEKTEKYISEEFGILKLIIIITEGITFRHED